MTHIHSTLHVFSKIGHGMLFSRSVLVRDTFFSFFKIYLFFQLSKIYRSPCVHWTEVCGFYSFPIKTFIFSFFLFFHRFGETSSIAVLAMFISQYKITVKEEPQFVGETFEERKSRILSSRTSVTLTYVSNQEPFVLIDKNGSFLFT